MKKILTPLLTFSLLTNITFIISTMITFGNFYFSEQRTGILANILFNFKDFSTETYLTLIALSFASFFIAFKNIDTSLDKKSEIKYNFLSFGFTVLLFTVLLWWLITFLTEGIGTNAINQLNVM